MMTGHEPVTSFEQWYEDYDVDPHTGCLRIRNSVGMCGQELSRMWDQYKREMDLRVAKYGILEQLADGEVISPKPDLPNVSSGETAGIVRRIARNLVQNTPNVEIICEFDDDSLQGIFARHILLSKIIGVEQYSNDMQQNLFASTKSAFALGFNCVIPMLMEDAAGAWSVKYDTIHYRDVFPEPGARDIRAATNVFIRRYLTRGEVAQMIQDTPIGWDVAALRLMYENLPSNREQQSVDHQTKKHHQIPDGYEIITWYSSSGRPFLTFDARNRALLRIEVNKHPLKQHPVHFLVLEKDENQPLGKSQVELLIGRQDFQDLMLNGAMKLWYRNINPSILGFGVSNAVPNLGPGKYTQIPNPNARIEPFEVNTQTLMQYGLISQQNLGSMVNLVGAADQQMATQAGNGMSATPQGVEAQVAMVDTTTNNYQKAIEGFFSHYCSYALTMYFQEMKGVKQVKPTAEARLRLLKAGLKPYDPEAEKKSGMLNEDGTLDIDFDSLAVEYFVRCVPGSLVEIEDEKQLRLLNELFIPLSQAMPALANSGDPTALQHASLAMSYIIRQQIRLSGSSHSADIEQLLKDGDIKMVDERDERIANVERVLGGLTTQSEEELSLTTEAVAQLQEQVGLISQNMGVLLEKLGVVNNPPAEQPNSYTAPPPEDSPESPRVALASA